MFPCKRKYKFWLGSTHQSNEVEIHRVFFKQINVLQNDKYKATKPEGWTKESIKRQRGEN